MNTQINQPASRKRQVAFYLVIVAYAALLLSFVAPFLHYTFTGWFKGEELGIHQFHEINLASLFWLFLLGMLIQFYKPTQQIGAMQQSVAVIAVFLGVMLIVNDFMAPLLLFPLLVGAAVVLHPARRLLVRSEGPMNLPLLGLALAGAVPLLGFAGSQIALQRQAAPGDEHAVFGHWGIMASLALSILVLALVASLRSRGWRVPAWTAGALALIYGLASVAFPAQASSGGLLWGGISVAWGAAFIAVAELTRQQRRLAERALSAA